MRATVKIVNGENDERAEIYREIDVPVRLNMQGYASVELCVDALNLWPLAAGTAEGWWMTLGNVIEHPAVRNVTFR